MNFVKVVHCADLHIGAELGTLGTKARKRRTEIKQVFKKIINLCTQEEVNLLLIAGDFFDGSQADTDMFAEMRDLMAEHKELYIVLVSGNHDPATVDSLYLDESFWPENVIRFCGSFDKKDIPALGVRIYGAGFTEPYSQRSLMPQHVRAPKDNYINICVIHGEMVNESGKSDYNPITESQLADSGMSYVALGHIHKRSEIKRAGNTYYAYPGCPEGRGFDELEDKGVYIGTISREECHLEYRSVCTRMNIELRVDAGKIFSGEDDMIKGSTAQIASAIREEMRARYGENYSEHLYKIVLEGEISEGANINVQELQTVLAQDAFYLKVIDHTIYKLDMEVLLKETSLQGIYARKIAEKQEDLRSKGGEDAELTGAAAKKAAELDMALQFGFKAFNGDIEMEDTEN